MIKTYVTRNACNLVTSVFIEGEEYPVEFRGGHTRPYRRHGTFSTGDEKLQAALENDIGYGVSFELEQVQEQVPEPSGTACLREIPEVETRQLALEWLEREAGVRLPRSSRIETVCRTAEEHGVVFNKLKK